MEIIFNLRLDYLDPYLNFKTKFQLETDSFRSVLKLTMTYPMDKYVKYVKNIEVI